jgi:hypothetical protein
MACGLRKCGIKGNGKLDNMKDRKRLKEDSSYSFT